MTSEGNSDKDIKAELSSVRQSEERYRALAEAAFEAIVLHRNGTIIGVNHAFHDIFGYEPGEAIGMSVLMLAVPEWRDLVLSKVNTSSEEPYEAVGLRKDGSTFRGLVRGRNISYRGRPARITSVGDISERIRAVEALRESEEMFRSLAEKSPNMIFIHQGGRVVYANEQCERLTGYSRDELCRPDFDFLTLIAPESIEIVKAQLAKHIRGEEVPPYEYSVLASDGRRIQALCATRLIGYQGTKAILGVITDISDRKRAEQERLGLEQQILHAQKLESLGVLAGGIAHDFNNLLMGVLGYASLILGELAPEAPMRPAIEKIEQAALRAADLTNQMLAYSGKGKFVVRKVQLSDVVTEIARLLEVSISKKTSLRFDFKEDLPPIEADATQLRQVIMNLITNASEAIGDRSGVVSIATGSITADSDYLAGTYPEHDLPEGEYVFLEVSDTGCGMDQETVSKIFDPFFSTKFTGRGLGLAAVLGIVRGHQGTIKVYSEQGTGTNIKVLFPAADPGKADLAGSPRPEPGGEVSGLGRCVLVVDDDSMVREVACSILESVGFEVCQAGNGEEGVKVFESRADEIDLVLLDTTMPKMGGEEAFRRMRRIRPDVRVVLTSGYNEQEVTSRFAGKELSGFLQKPFRALKLLKTIGQILSTKR